MATFNQQHIIQLCINQLADLNQTPVNLISITVLGGGCINNAMRINCTVGKFFMKWNASAPADLFLREAEGLNEMNAGENGFICIPNVIWAKCTDKLPGLILMEFLPPAIDTNGYNEKLGRGIAQMHRMTSGAFGFHHNNYCGTTLQDNSWKNSWPEFFGQQRIWNMVEQLKWPRQLSSYELRSYERLVERIPQLLAHETKPSFIHGDLWSGNYLFTTNGPALIDPACYYADREMELGMMLLFGGFSQEVWSAYQNEFPLPDGWQERIEIYQLYHILNHYLLFGGSYRQQALKIAKRYL